MAFLIIKYLLSIFLFAFHICFGCTIVVWVHIFPSSGQICKFNDTGKVCVIRLLYRLHGDPAANTQAQRPRDLERTAIHLHAGYCSTLLRLCSRENHAGEKLLCLPQGSTSEVCLVFTILVLYQKKRDILYVTVWQLFLRKLPSHPWELQLRELETVGQHYAPLCRLN